MRAALLLSSLFACRAAPPPPSPPSDQVTSRTREQMSTIVSVSVAAPESPAVLAAIDAAFAEIDRLQEVLSEWRPSSQLAELNRRAGEGPVTVDAELIETARIAREVAEASGGAFDPTWAALSGLWDFRAAEPRLPDPAELARRVGLIDYRQLTIDASRRTLALSRPGMKVGLGGVAKGYVVDRASATLTARGYPHHLVVAGGDLYAAGRKASKRWTIGVRAPQGVGLYGTLELEDQGVATSGNYERYFIKDGVRYHHILDPATGYPARGLSSVTAVAKSAALADAFATAVFVLGAERGLALAAARSDLEVLLFDDERFAARRSADLVVRVAPTAAAGAPP